MLSVIETSTTDRKEVGLLDVDGLASLLIKERETVVGGIWRGINWEGINITWYSNGILHSTGGYIPGVRFTYDAVK